LRCCSLVAALKVQAASVSLRGFLTLGRSRQRLNGQFNVIAQQFQVISRDCAFQAQFCAGIRRQSKG